MERVGKTAILAELASRNSTVKYNPIVLSPDFPKQNAFIEDTSRYIDAQCSRRAGKSNGLAMRFFKTMEKYPKSQCMYLSLTQESARGIMWGILQEIDAKYNIGCTFTETRLEMKHPNGAKLKLMGADLKNFIKRLKGRKFPGVGVDEAQDMGPHLQSLIDDVLTPSISDYADGWLAMTGTPGPVPQGYFFDVTHNKKYGFSHHAWTLLENPHMPNPQQFLKELKAKREWLDSNPTLLREYLNNWVLDVDALWIKYSEKINHFQQLPVGHVWNHVMGVDIGFKDADAIAVLAWSETSPVTYLVEEVITTKQGISALAAQIDAIQKKYGAYRIVMDEGGLGKKIGEDFRSRFGCPIEPAAKERKQDNVELLNDSMRLGQFMAKGASRFAQDSYMVQIDWDKSTPKRIQLKKNFHSDIIDAVLYAFRDTYAYTHKPEPTKPRYGSKEWADSQANTMFEAELQGYLAQEEFSKKNYGQFD